MCQPPCAPIATRTSPEAHSMRMIPRCILNSVIYLLEICGTHRGVLNDIGTLIPPYMYVGLKLAL